MTRRAEDAESLRLVEAVLGLTASGNPRVVYISADILSCLSDLCVLGGELGTGSGGSYSARGTARDTRSSWPTLRAMWPWPVTSSAMSTSPG